jgi:hypothetical protein
MVRMDFSNLVVSWKDSFDIFKKKNIVLFLLASLNTFRRSLLLLVKKFWWIFIIFFITDLYFYFWGSAYVSRYDFFTWCFLKSFLYFYAILAARPSIERKDMGYFTMYTQKYLVGILAVLLFFYFDFIFFLFWVFAFHYIDSKPGIKTCLYSFLVSFKIVLYHFPVFIVLGISKFLLDGMIYLYCNLKHWGINYFFGQSKVLFFIADQFVMILFGFIALLFISFVSIYYTKSKHKNFDFFFRGA